MRVGPAPGAETLKVGDTVANRETRFINIWLVALAGFAVVVGAAAALWYTGTSGDDEKVVAGEVALSSDGEQVGFFTASEAIRRAEEIVGFDIAVPEKLPHPDLRLDRVAADVHPVDDEPTLVTSTLIYMPGAEFEAGKPVLTVRQFPEEGLVPPRETDTEVVDMGLSKVYIDSAMLEGSVEALSFLVIGAEHPHLHITSQAIAREDVLDMIRTLVAP